MNARLTTAGQSVILTVQACLLSAGDPLKMTPKIVWCKDSRCKNRKKDGDTFEYFQPSEWTYSIIYTKVGHFVLLWSRPRFGDLQIIESFFLLFMRTNCIADHRKVCCTRVCIFSKQFSNRSGTSRLGRFTFWCVFPCKDIQFCWGLDSCVITPKTICKKKKKRWQTVFGWVPVSVS